MSKAILCCVSFACNKMQNQIFELPEVKEVCFISEGFSNRKKGVGAIQGTPFPPPPPPPPPKKKDSFTHSSLAPRIENLLHGPCTLSFLNFPYEKRNFREFTARFRQSHDNLIGKPVDEDGTPDLSRKTAFRVKMPIKPLQ